MSKQTLVKEELSSFGDIVSDLPLVKKKPARNLESELFKTSHQAEMIDAFEQRVGIANKPVKKDNVVIKVKLFKFGYVADINLYTKLLNSPKYRILQIDKNWDMNGELIAFIHYSDNLDITEPQSNE